MIRIKINEDDLLNMLVERVEYWTDDAVTIDLFSKMYEHSINDGCFEDAELDVMQIVDNDYVNYCKIINDGDDDFQKVQQLAKDGEYDISCETCYSFIEAHDDDFNNILVRY